MVNTNNTKFTFNKKGFALSLACVGLLATAGNATIEPASKVSAINKSETNYNVTAALGKGDILTIKGEGNVLGFSGGTAKTISGGVTFNGTGSFTELNLFNVDAKGLILKNDLNISVNAGTINVGEYKEFTKGDEAFATSGAFTISGGALNFGNNTFDKVSFNNLKFSGGGTITNTGHIKEMVIEQYGIVNKPSKDDTGEMKFQNTGTIDILTNKTNMLGKGFKYSGDATASGAITLEMGNIGTYNQQASLGYLTINGGTFGVFNNSVEDSKGFINQSTINNITVGTFNNDGWISKSTITGASITTFNNTGFDGKKLTTIDQNGGGLHTVTLKNSTIGTLYNTGQIRTATFSGGVIGTLINSGSGVITGLNTTNGAYIKDVFNNAGTITNSTIQVGQNENNLATKFTNSGEISSNGSAANKLTVFTKDFTNEGKINFASGGKTGTIDITADNFTNAKDAQIDFTGANGGLKITANKTFDNKGTIKGISGADTTKPAGTITLKSADSERNVTFSGTNSGLIQVDTIKFEGLHKSFDNFGTISGGTISATGNNVGISTFTNTATGVIKGSTIKVDGADFKNLGTITAETGSKIEVSNSFNNASGANFTLGGTLTLTSEVRDTKTTFNNAGLFSGGIIDIEKNVLTFNNDATGVIKGTEISGTGTILSLTNDGVMSVKANGANIAKFQNNNDFTLSGGGTLNVLTSFYNAENAILTAINAGTIQLGDNKKKAANTTETTFVNAGTIDGKGNLEISTANGWVKSFTNTNTGLITDTKITSGGATDGIVTFTNSGTIDNSTLQVNVVNFNNLEGGLIDFGDTANNSIKLSGKLDKTASFNNAGTIDNLPSAISVDTDVVNVSFTNSGTISQIDGATNTAVLSLTGASNVLNFNNSGTIALADANTSGAIIVAATTAAAGAKANIINTGAITLGNGGAQHMDLTNITKAKDAPFVVKEWHLSNIGSADSYNGNGTSNGTDKIVVKGFSRDFKAGTSNLRFDKGSIVIDPVKNPNMVSGQPYLLDRIVVNEKGAPVEEVYKIDTAANTVTAGDAFTKMTDATNGKFKLNDAGTQYVLKEGETDPRLVTIDTIRSNDPIFELYGVDAYGVAVDKDGKLIKGKLGKVGEEVAGTTGAEYKEDGIIDSFQVGVNPSKGAGAAAVQSTVNNSITRNAFVGNVVNTAVNSALASLNNLNRVSYNDAEVDFSELEKYAAVSSDVAEQTYAKDSNVYVMPYYRSTSVDLAEGSLDADTYGIVLGGNKSLGNAGVIGLFLGYENADGSANTLDTEDDTFFGGINYYKTLGGTSTYDYFVKGMLRLANTSSDVTRKGQTYGTSSADTFSYGIEANVGMNFYNGIHTITPEVGLSYDRVEVDGFKLNGIDYSDNNINLVVGKIGLNWLAQFTESVSTNVGFGIRYNFNDDFDTSLRIANGEVYSTNTDLGDFYYYLNLGVNYAITSNWELGVMYNGDFSSDANSHSGFVKLGYWW